MDRVRIQIRFGYNVNDPYSKFTEHHGKIVEVDLTEERSWEDVFANDFQVPLRSEDFVVQGHNPRETVKHSLKKGARAVLQECAFMKKHNAYPIYVVYKDNMLKKSKIPPSSRNTVKQATSRRNQAVKSKKKAKSYDADADVVWRNTRPTARQQAKALKQQIKIPEMQDKVPPRFLNTRNDLDHSYANVQNYNGESLAAMDDDQEDNESLVSQFSQFEERTKTVGETRNNDRTVRGNPKQSSLRHDKDQSVSHSMSDLDLRDAIKRNVDNFGRRNLLKIREEMKIVMSRDGQYAKWGMVAPSATFFLEQIFQLRGNGL